MPVNLISWHFLLLFIALLMFKWSCVTSSADLENYRSYRFKSYLLVQVYLIVVVKVSMLAVGDIDQLICQYASKVETTKT
jgi:hypothetical protein